MSTGELRGTSSAGRTLDQRDLASLRPQIAPKPKPRRAAPVLREVTSGIVCFCGQRFGESEALEFMLHLRAEVGEVLNWQKRIRTRDRVRWARRKADPENRARLNEQARASRARRMADPEYRARLKEQDRARRARRRAEVSGGLRVQVGDHPAAAAG